MRRVQPGERVEWEEGGFGADQGKEGKEKEEKEGDGKVSEKSAEMVACEGVEQEGIVYVGRVQ